MDEKEKQKEEAKQQYELIFRNGALENLKKLASDFGIPEDDLRQVVNKGIQILKLTKDAKFLIFEDKNGDRFKIDMSKL